MFDEVTKKEGGKRAARRSVWVAGSTVVQAGLIFGVITLSAAIAQHEVEAPLVDVKLVKAAPPPAPPPPPPPPAPRRKSAPKPRTDAPKPASAFVQPKEMPDELKPPDPNPEPDDGADDGVEGGVVGGVVGGVAGSAPAPPPTPKPAGPVKFTHDMAKPELLGGPELQYTQQALDREIEGTMVVECVVRVDGTVHSCRVLKGLPFMDGAVVATLQRRRYKPATLNGVPVEVQYTFTIQLKLPQ